MKKPHTPFGKMIVVYLLTVGCAGWTAPAVGAELEVPGTAGELTERVHVLIDALDEYGLAFDPEVAYTAVVDSLIRAADPRGHRHSEDAEEQLRRRRLGVVYDVGLTVAITNEIPVIESVQEGSPAAEAGIKEGEQLVEVEGSSVDLLSPYQIASRLRADEPKPLSLAIRDAEQNISTQRLDRVETQLPAIGSSKALPFQIGYVQINRLLPDTGADVADRLAKWADDDFYGILLDLRGADGEDLDSVREIADLFAKEETFLFAYRDQHDQDVIHMQTTSEAAVRMPVMVLIDGTTGGAAEVLAAVLNDSVRGAMLFGRPTRGDFMVRETITLPDEMMIYLTTRRLTTGNGTVYTGAEGVYPDVVVDRETTEATQPRRSMRTEVVDEEIEQEKLYHQIRGDASLRRAVDVLLGLKALGIRPL